MDLYVKISPLFLYEVYFMIKCQFHIIFGGQRSNSTFLLDLFSKLVFTEECFKQTNSFISYLESW